MSQSTVDTPVVKRMRPSDWIGLAFAIYSQQRAVSDIGEEPNNEEVPPSTEPLYEFSARIQDRVKRLGEKHDPDTREGLYVTQCMMAVESFVSGLLRQRRRHAQRVAAANEEKKVSKQNRVLVLTNQGLLRGGAQLLLAGGFLGAITYGLLSVSGFEDLWTMIWFSVSSFFGAALTMAHFLSRRMTTSISEIELTHKARLAEADTLQAAGLEEEYRHALNLLYQAETLLHDGELEREEGAEIALLTLMRHNAQIQPAQTPPRPNFFVRCIRGWREVMAEWRKKPHVDEGSKDESADGCKDEKQPTPSEEAGSSEASPSPKDHAADGSHKATATS